MEAISKIDTYNTDINGSWGIGQEPKFDSYYSLEEILREAIGKKAKIIVKTSSGSWYIKGTNDAKTYDDIKLHLQKMESENYKNKSRTWLLKYV